MSHDAYIVVIIVPGVKEHSSKWTGQPRWICRCGHLSRRTGGSRVAPAFFAGATLVVAGRRFESLGMGATYAGELTVDDAARPKQFAFSFRSGPEQGEVWGQVCLMY